MNRTINYGNIFTLESLETIGFFNRRAEKKIIIDGWCHPE